MDLGSLQPLGWSSLRQCKCVLTTAALIIDLCNSYYYCCLQLYFRVIVKFLKRKKILKKRIIKEINRKQKKIWANNFSEFYNESMNSWLQNNNIQIYLKNN